MEPVSSRFHKQCVELRRRLTGLILEDVWARKALLPEGFLVDYVGHLGHVAAVIPLQHIN